MKTVLTLLTLTALSVVPAIAEDDASDELEEIVVVAPSKAAREFRRKIKNLLEDSGGINVRQYHKKLLSLEDFAMENGLQNYHDTPL